MQIIPAAATLAPPPSGRPPVINLAPRDVAALADDLDYAHTKDPKFAEMKIALVPNGPKKPRDLCLAGVHRDQRRHPEP
jgi:hypothetical protein